MHTTLDELLETLHTINNLINDILEKIDNMEIDDIEFRNSLHERLQ